MNINKAFVLTAGFGSRFTPQTHFIPKPALPIFNLPQALYPTALLKKAGVDDFFYNSHHLPEKLSEALKPFFKNSPIFEPNILSSAGGISNAREYLQHTENFWVVNGDSFLSCNNPELINALTEFHIQNEALATLVCINKEKPEVSGLTLNQKTKQLVSIERTPEALQFVGLYILSSEIFKTLKSTRSNIFNDALLLPEIKKRAYVFDATDELIWYETGNESDYMNCLQTEANRLQENKESSAIFKTHQVWSDENLEPKFKRFKQTLVWSNDNHDLKLRDGFLSLGDNCSGELHKLKNCEVFKNLQIKTEKRIEGKLLVDPSQWL